MDHRALCERLSAAFAENFRTGGEVGAGVSVWLEGEEICSIYEGYSDGLRDQQWTADTMVLVWSATKGMAAACAMHAMQASGINPLQPISRFWPEFSKNGKEAVTCADVLSHRAGLAAIEGSKISIFDHEAVVEALEDQEPLWAPRSGHGYSPRTFGFLADEIVRRITGLPLGEYWREIFAIPMELDFWIGLPGELHARVAQMLPPRIAAGQTKDPFLLAMADPGSLTRAAFSSLEGLGSVSAMNSTRAREASLPSLGGIGTPRAVAKFYQMLALGGQWQGRRFFAPDSLQWMQTRLVNGLDKTILMDTAFSVGFMLDPVGRDGRKTRMLFGPSLPAFGHPGAGGSMAFADPMKKLGFAYLMNQMEIGVLPSRRAQNLVNAVYGLPADGNN
jgi:CubicO group peptidase (beta-lactamase class C family)